MKWTLLHHACWAGDNAEVTRLLDAGANPNQIAPTNWRQSPLGRTLEFRISNPKHEGHVEVVRTLLARGADPTVRSTQYDMTPYELACFCGLEPAAAMLKKHQAKASPHPTGMPAIWLAAASRIPVKLPKEDPNVIWNQTTPLMMATAHAKNFDVADALLAAGADPNLGISLLHAHWHFQHLVPALKYLARHGWNAKASGALEIAQRAGLAATARVLAQLS